MHYEFDDLPIRLHDGGEVLFEISGCCGIDTSFVGNQRDIDNWTASGISVGYSDRLTHLEYGQKGQAAQFGRLCAYLIEDALARERGAEILERLAEYYGVYHDDKAEHGHFQWELV